MRHPEPVRIILDVNVIVSALISQKGAPYLILEKIIEDNSNIKLVMSKEIFAELRGVLSYPSVKKYIRKDKREVDEFVNDIELISELHETSGYNCDKKSRDADDDKYLLLAEAAKPDFIVSGDSDLTDLLSVGNVRIISPRAFWVFIEGSFLQNN
ncbi:MAG: putative toxin-antitoxin system toxin component, PIN family [Lentisphaerae bacterium]|nr:putative toxin-antitoxin system toxin component, PIN family [Lentisphaerota bacterium]